MIKVIAGKQGSGKTKQIIELVNKIVEDKHGEAVCIENGQKLRFDIHHGARLVDISVYPVNGYEALLAFMAGIHAANYDVSHIFIDSLFKVAGTTDLKATEEFLDKLEVFEETHNVEFTLTISMDIDTAPEGIKKYFV